MDVTLTIDRVRLHSQRDRFGVFTSAKGGDVIPGQKSYQQWAGDGTEPTDWTEAEFIAALRETAHDKGWNITEIIDARKQGVNSHGGLLRTRATHDTANTGGKGTNWEQAIHANHAEPLNVLIVDRAIDGTGGMIGDYIAVRDHAIGHFKVTQANWDSTDRGWFRPEECTKASFDSILQADQPHIVVFTLPGLIHDDGTGTQQAMIAAITASTRLPNAPKVFVQEPDMLLTKDELRARDSILKRLAAEGVQVNLVTSTTPAILYEALMQSNVSKAGGTAATRG